MRQNKTGKQSMAKRAGAALLAAVTLLFGSSFGSVESHAAYNDTNLNTFIHNGASVPEGEAGMPFTINFRFGYDGKQGLNNPGREEIKDVNVRLSNDQTYMGVQVEIGENQTAFKERLEKILGYDFENDEAFQQYLDGYEAGYSDAGSGTILYNFPVDSGSYPFEVDGALFRQSVHFDTVKQGEYQDISFQVTVRKDTKPGYYAIPIQFEYKLPDIAYVGQDYPTRVEYINVYIREASEQSGKPTAEQQFVIGEGQMTPAGTYPSVMNFGVNIRNQKEKVYDVTVKFNTSLGKDAEMKKTALAKSYATTGFPFDINETNYDRHFDEIGRDETVTAPYSMAISAYTASGFYPLSYTVSYRKLQDGPLYEEEHAFMVRVTNPTMEDEAKDQDDKEWNANTATKARLIVDSYRLEPEKIYAGDSFDLIINMKNASDKIDASNILLTFEAETTSDKSAIFSTENGANSVVINSLPSGKTEEVRMRYTARAGVDQGSYKITIKEQYDSPEFKNATEEVSVDVPVYQYARLSASSFEVMPSSLEVGSESNVMFGINNTGKVTLYNVAVRFSADSIKENNSYIGNIKPGETGNVDVMLQAVAATSDDGMITAEISYEDENGAVSKETKEFELFVSEPMPDMMGEDMFMEGMGDMMEEPENPVVAWVKENVVLMVLAAALAVLAASIVIRKKRRKKREAAIDLEDEEI